MVGYGGIHSCTRDRKPKLARDISSLKVLSGGFGLTNEHKESVQVFAMLVEGVKAVVLDQQKELLRLEVVSSSYIWP